MEHFNSTTYTEVAAEPQSQKWNTVFQSFLSNYIKQVSSTTASHRKGNISMLKQCNIFPSKLSTLLENTYCCAKHYICATALYLFSVLSQYFYVIIDYGVSASVHCIEVVDFPHDTLKFFLLQLMSAVNFPGEKGYDTQMEMHYGTPTSDVTLAQ